MMTCRSEIIATIRAERKRRKITIKQIAEATGVNEMTISRWERGHGSPTLSRLLVVMDYLGLTLEVRGGGV